MSMCMIQMLRSLAATNYGLSWGDVSRTAAEPATVITSRAASAAASAEAAAVHAST